MLCCVKDKACIRIGSYLGAYLSIRMVQSYCSGTRFKHRYIYLVIHEFRLILGPLESQGVDLKVEWNIF